MPALQDLPRIIRRHAHPIAALLLLAMAALLAAGALADSPVVDEPGHLTRGLAWWTADTRLSTSHPPLANLLQGIPGALMGAGDVDWERLKGWQLGSIFQIASAYFGLDYERARAALMAGRAVTIALTLLLGLYLYRFFLRWGRLRALAVLALYALCPQVLAHGHYVTTDMPVVVASTVAVLEFTRYVRTPGWKRLATFSLATGAALAIKFSAAFLIPALGLAGAVACARARGRFRAPGRWLLLARDLAVTTAICVLVVNASFRFEGTGWTVRRILSAPEPQSWLSGPFEGRTMETLSPVGKLPRWVPVPLPYSYLFGAATISAQSARGHGHWFAGERSDSALYFPVLLVVKNSAALVLLVFGAAALWLARRARVRAVELAAWSAPVLLVLLSLDSKIHIGVRHVLPVFPFAIAAGGWALAALLRTRPLLGAAVLALAAAEALAAAPFFLGHFSWLTGGDAVGHRISMVGEDWGQDAGALAELVRERDLTPLFYVPYGVTTGPELGRRGVPFERTGCRGAPEGPGWVAIHAGPFVRGSRGCAGIPRDRPPDLKVNEHVWLWRVPLSAAP